MAKCGWFRREGALKLVKGFSLLVGSYLDFKKKYVTDYNWYWCNYLLSNLVPNVGCSGSSNDLSKDSNLAPFISDLN